VPLYSGQNLRAQVGTSFIGCIEVDIHTSMTGDVVDQRTAVAAQSGAVPSDSFGVVTYFHGYKGTKKGTDYTDYHRFFVLLQAN
jgi:hypothetical protein